MTEIPDSPASRASAERETSSGGELRKRVVSAVIMGRVAALALWAGKSTFNLLVAVVGLIMSWEWGRVVRGCDVDHAFIAHAAAVTAALGLSALDQWVLALAVLVAGSAAVFMIQRTYRPFLSLLGLAYVGIPGMALIGERLEGQIKKHQAASETPMAQSSFDDLEGHVIIAGFGRVGHVFANILEKEDATFVSLERDALAVSRARNEGWRVYLGDAARAEILQKAGAMGADLFVVTVDDPVSAESMVKAMRALRPNIHIVARARDADHAASLRKVGADVVIPDAIEAGLQMAGMALEHFGYDGETVRDRLALHRDSEYEMGTKEAS